MRIPLDLYQILGVPMQAKPEQLQQAFEDRQQQLPRSQYTETAIASRNQLLKQAYAVLAKKESRAEYDRTLRLERGPGSTSTSELSAETTAAVGMALADHQLVGGLLLLQDMGKYSTILDLGADYLNRSIDLNHVPTPTDIAEEDVILSMALAYLESGREYWQQQQFVAAAKALQQGSDLLAQENLFGEINQEIQVDLHKLRPYQVLQLLSLDEGDPERQQGLTLLQAMLDQRGGIEGHDDDQSGLGIDDFLRFIQQLRSHLTVQEQQDLFQEEANRPSAVASYLASYALVAGGFSRGQPIQIKQAQDLLGQLSRRQDIYIEQAMCSLLLGQPNRAVQTLTYSEDEDSLAFIRQYADDDDDVPGLFLYTEHWLQQEVYPYFRDLAGQALSLQDYFNNQRIQAALCALEPDVARGTAPTPPPTPTPATLVANPALTLTDTPAPPRQAAAIAGTPAQSSPAPSAHPDDPWRTEQDAPSLIQDRAIFAPAPAQPAAPPSAAPAAPAIVRQGEAPGRSRKRPSTRRPSQQSSSLKWVPWVGAAILGLIGIGGVAALVFRPASPDATDLASPSPEATPSVSTPVASPQPSPPPAEQGLSTAAARQVIQSWQTIKAAGRGQQHDVDQFKQILVNPKLSTWTQQAKRDQAKNAYFEYELHQLTVEKVEPVGTSKASVYVQIEETANYFVNGKKDPKSYEKDQYRVRYELTKQQGQWRIKDWQTQAKNCQNLVPRCYR